jgi:hypothetical protein
VIDFEKATVTPKPSPATSPRYELTVTGKTPSMSQRVKLVPVTYIRQPEYWAIQVSACHVGDVLLPAEGRFSATLDLTGSLGTQGIEVVGKTRSQKIDLTAPAFVGSWAVTGVTGGITGGIIPVFEGSSISLVFGADHTVSGRSCNTYQAIWSRGEGTALAIAKLTQSTLPCPGPGIPEQEQRYFGALGQVGSWRLDGGRLTLVSGDGRDVVTAVRAT